MLKTARQYITPANGVLAIALLIAASWVWGTIVAIQNNFTLQQQVDSLRQANAYDELANETQQFQNQYYASNEYLELSVRQHLGKAAPGEKVLILPPNTVATPPAKDQASSVTPIAQRSNFAQWEYFLFGQK